MKCLEYFFEQAAPLTLEGPSPQHARDYEANLTFIDTLLGSVLEQVCARVFLVIVVVAIATPALVVVIVAAASSVMMIMMMVVYCKFYPLDASLT
jgi:hypothetical protein